MAKLFSVMIDAVAKTGELRNGTITSSPAANSFVDATRIESQDAFVGGTVFFVRLMKTATVTAYDQATHRITFTPSFANPVPILVADQYMVTAVDRDAIVDMVNNALSAMGRYVAIGVVTASVTYERGFDTLSFTNTISDIIKIERSFDGGHYQEVINYEELANDGSGNTIVHIKEDYQVSTGPVIEQFRITYLKSHPRVYADTDAVLTPYNVTRIAQEAAFAYYLQRMAIKGNADDKEQILLQTLQLQMQQVRTAYPVKHRQKSVKLPRF